MSGEWIRVKWTEARQVTRLLDWRARDDEPDHGMAPQAFFLSLRSQGRDAEAAEFLGQALPRWEAVAWAARAVRDLKGIADGDPDAAALKSALLWVQDPTEQRRRAAYDAAEAAEATSPERLAALAAFYSGGSVAPADCEPQPAPREAAGRFAAGAVLVAAMSGEEPDAALARCLETGAALAGSGDGAGAEEGA